MTRPLVVAPHGTGIGDVINARPLIEAIVARHRGRDVRVLAPSHLAWLLPPGVTILPYNRLLRLWRRIDSDTAVARWLGRLDARITAPVVKRISPRAAARGLTGFLRYKGFEVISLLEHASRLDLDTRWTAGPWSTGREHIIDLLAEALEEEGIPVPLHRRTPRLTVQPRTMEEGPSVILSPNAGSTLKEPTVTLWIEVARTLRLRGITPLVLVAPGRSTADEVVAAVPQVRSVGSADLREVAATLAGADVVISPDSGILHLSAAVGTRWVGLFGATDPQFLGPYDWDGGVVLQTRVEHAEVCQGCWTAQMLPAARCALFGEDTCLRDIGAGEVVGAVEELLAQSAPIGGSRRGAPSPRMGEGDGAPAMGPSRSSRL